MPIGHDAAAHTGSQRDHDKILHTLGRAIHHFADGRCIGIIGQDDWAIEIYPE